MGMRMFRVSALAVMVATGLAVAACGSQPAGSQSSSKLMPEVQAAAQSATSVHMTGYVTQGSQTVTIDASFSGTSLAGTVGLNGATIDVLSLNGKSYVKLDAAFLKVSGAPASVCARICGKYLQMPPATASQITGSLGMRLLIKNIFNNKSMSDAAATGCVFSPATHDGQAVLQCRQGPYTVDVAAHGKPYLLYFSAPHGQYITFSDWNAVTLPAAPSGSQVVSIPGLG